MSLKITETERIKMPSPSPRKLLFMRVDTLAVLVGIFGMIFAGLMTFAFELLREMTDYRGSGFEGATFLRRAYPQFIGVSPPGLFFSTLKAISDGLMISGVLMENPLVVRFWVKASAVATFVAGLLLVGAGYFEIAIIVITINAAILNCGGFWIVHYYCAVLDSSAGHRDQIQPTLME